jgi:hypothetical protein
MYVPIRSSEQQGFPISPRFGRGSTLQMYMEGTLLDKLLERSIECEGYLTKLKMINETQETV